MKKNMFGKDVQPNKKELRNRLTVLKNFKQDFSVSIGALNTEVEGLKKEISDRDAIIVVRSKQLVLVHTHHT